VLKYPAELTEDTHEDDHERTPACGRGVEEFGVVVPPLVGAVERDVLLEFDPFEFDHGMIGVVVAVVGCEEIAGLVVVAVSHEPSGRFGLNCVAL
jgi:hypothetical protein